MKQTKCSCKHLLKDHNKYIDGGTNKVGGRLVCTKDNCTGWDMCDLPEDPEFCYESKRVDGKYHSWHFNGDDPYVICFFCKETRDTITGVRIK